MKGPSYVYSTRLVIALRGKMEGTLTDPRVMAAILFVIMGVLYAILLMPICNWKGLS